MSDKTGKIVAVNGNMVSVEFSGNVRQNEVGYAILGDMRLKAEVIRVHGAVADLQVFEDTRGLKIGDDVDFTNELLTVEVGPGLLKAVYDGLQNPLPDLAKEAGYFLQRGLYLQGLDRKNVWKFTPVAKAGDTVKKTATLGTVPEGTFTHKIMVPFLFNDTYTVEWVSEAGEFNVDQVIAKLKDSKGQTHEVKMVQEWPVKISNKNYAERLAPTEPLVTGQRIVDTFFPVNKGGS